MEPRVKGRGSRYKTLDLTEVWRQYQGHQDGATSWREGPAKAGKSVKQAKCVPAV